MCFRVEFEKYITDDSPRMPKAPMKYQDIDETQLASRELKSIPRCINCLNRSVNGNGTLAVKNPLKVYETHLKYASQLNSVAFQNLPSNNNHWEHIGHLTF